MSEPTQHTTGATVDTSSDNLVPPGMTSHEESVDDPGFQVLTLAAFLAETFPSEVALSNRQRPETPVETAIRLLQGFVSTTPPTQVQRCDQEYCNQPAGHTTACPSWTQAG